MDEFPSEIMSNILTRLPVKSCFQLRCVCKPWCEILTDSKFPLIHFNQISTISPDILLYSPLALEIFYVDDSKEEFGENPIKPVKVFDQNFIHNSFYENSTILGFCNGFICLSQIDNFSLLPCNPIYIFNPITEARLDVPHYTQTGVRSYNLCMYGFGCEDPIKEYKIVLVMFSLSPLLCKNEVQVYTVGGTTWRRKTGIAPDVLSRAATTGSSAIVSGCLHWVVNNQKDGILIVSFNLGVENFGFVPIPLTSLHEHVRFTIGVLEDHLSAVEYSDVDYFHIWLLKKYNVKESWVKQFSIKRDSLSCPRNSFIIETLKYRKNGELLLLCDSENFVSYNIESQKSRSFKIEGVGKKRKRILQGKPFVGSLVSPNSTCGMDSDNK